MDVYGVDFINSLGRKKPIICRRWRHAVRAVAECVCVDRIARVQGGAGVGGTLDRGDRPFIRDVEKEDRRRTDALAGSLSVQELYSKPVGKMFFHGAPRWLRPGSRCGASTRRQELHGVEGDLDALMRSFSGWRTRLPPFPPGRAGTGSCDAVELRGGRVAAYDGRNGALLRLATVKRRVYGFMDCFRKSHGSVVRPITD